MSDHARAAPAGPQEPQLYGLLAEFDDPNLLVGNDKRDDAAVYRLIKLRAALLQDSNQS